MIFDIWFMIFDISFMIFKCIHKYMYPCVYVHMHCGHIEYDLHAINLSFYISQFDVPSTFLGQLKKWKRNHHSLKVNFIKFWKSNRIWFWWLLIPGGSCEKWGERDGQWSLVGCLCVAADVANVQDVAVEVQDGCGKMVHGDYEVFLPGTNVRCMCGIWPGKWWLEDHRFLLGCLVSWQLSDTL